MSLLDKTLINVFGFQYEGHEIWEVKNKIKIDNLIKPNYWFDVRDILYIKNQCELKQCIRELPFGWGLYDPNSECYILTNQFISNFNQFLESTYSVPMKKCIL